MSKVTPEYRSACDRSKPEDRDGRRSVRYRCNTVNIAQDVLCRRPGWVEAKENEDWDFIWCDLAWIRDNSNHLYMEEHVRINHFRNQFELCRKNLMVKNLKRHRKNLEKDFGHTEASKCDFFPRTFVLPNEYHLCLEEFKRTLGSTWIMKPAGKSQGKGIFLFRKLKEIMDFKKHITRSDEQRDTSQVENFVAQRYIENPYLINGRKFDLRVYVLVTSFVPLKAWLYREGFARFSNTRYSLSTIDDKYMHLTNVAIQKTAPDYDPESVRKWTVQHLRRYLTAKHGRARVGTLFEDIDNIFVCSLQSVQKVIINDKHCFELYGYDILLDENLKPWLIEVNASPSYVASSREDYEMKFRLLEDTLNVIDVERRLTGKEKRVGGFDLMWNGGPVHRDDVIPATCGSSPFPSNTHLGCVNDREKQLRRLLKPIAVKRGRENIPEKRQ
ncbi:probable tubulin polyglutamylase TTLL9 isoform X1 [Takifugu flavidus]|uniref:probable tubulin polyglutamylase TTLL9 isoform X1 n=1 Tax=Takifugu flavidus TaxID=433684 RepID=UPI0025449371|nr:probable tubulin polyglutamylase TTLL9 isoform X1 [Takifugu flavidus]